MKHIIQHLFRTDTLEDVPRERLEELVAEYPSFGIMRYLLSRKLRDDHSPDLTEETRITNLYFTNPFWLQWLLQHEDAPAVEKIDIPSRAMAPAEAPVVPDKPVIVHSVPPAADIAEPPSGYLAAVDEAASPMVAANEAVAIPYSEPERDEQSVEIPYPEPQPIIEPAAEDIAVPAPEAAIFVDPPEPVGYASNGQPAEEPAGRGDLITEPVNEFEAPTVAAHEAVEIPYPEPLAQASAGPSAVAAEAPLVFESYHMIDYFASQGIKLAPDENPTDRLGKQMKRFTEWLKVMKRLPQKEGEAVPDIIVEHQIQAIAAHSIEGREVVTETMAEVLAMQGMREKATEVYHKLSLLNPDKRAYFAAKIEQLKSN